MCSSTHFFNDRECFIRVTSSLGRCRFSLVYSTVVVRAGVDTSIGCRGASSSTQAPTTTPPLSPPRHFSTITLFFNGRVVPPRSRHHVPHPCGTQHLLGRKF